jgi:hypothetical protein
MAYVLVGIINETCDHCGNNQEIIIRVSGDTRDLEIFWEDFLVEENGLKRFKAIDGNTYLLKGYRIDEAPKL